MRKLIIASMLSVIGSAASAQANVTMYGIADMFAGHGKAGAFKQTRMNEGGNLASQLGIRGTEDLGGGLKANFNFEAGIATDTGAGNLPGPNLAFTRQSWVGLSSDAWGALTFGRQYTPIFRSIWSTDPFGVNAVFSTTGLWGQTEGQTGLLAWAARADNAIMYASPTTVPVRASVMWAPGEATALNTNNGNYASANLHYVSGPLMVGYGYQQRKSGTAAAPVASPTTHTAHLLVAHYGTAKFRLGGSYGFQDSTISGAANAKIININGQYNFTPSQAVLVSVGSRNVENTPNDQLSVLLGYNYDLSKRTVLYSRLLMLNNKGNAAVAGSGIVPATGSGADVRSIAVGMLHRF